MKSNKEIELYIGALSAQINSLRKTADTSEDSSELYNRLIIKKAILKKQTQKDNINSFFNRLKRKVLNKTKLICDYF